jgi:hypothetical protein
MASFTLTSQVFPNTTVVKAYPRSNWPTPELPSGAPVGSSSAEATMTNNTLTFTGLVQGTKYWAVAEVGGVYRYVRFTAGEDSTARSSLRMALEEVASANTISPSTAATLILVTGTTEVKKITATVAGHLIVLKFASTAKLVKGENLKIPANVEPTADDCLTLVCDGVNWYQVAPLQAN